MDVLKIVLTSVTSVVALFIIAKIMGHKQVAQFDFFDYICGITIGSIAAELAIESEGLWKPLLAMSIYGLSSVVLSLITRRLPRWRKFINGTPTILMKDGVIYRENLKKAKLDLSELMLLCREQGYFDPDEIQLAVFEHNGRLTILPRAACRPVTPTDLKIPATTTHIGVELIMDGRIMGENLARIGLDVKWLKFQLKTHGYEDASEILLGIYHEKEDRLSLYPLKTNL